MKKHKNKIISAAVIIAVLVVAWVWGGNYSKQPEADSGKRIVGSAGAVEAANAGSGDEADAPEQAKPDTTIADGEASPVNGGNNIDNNNSRDEQDNVARPPESSGTLIPESQIKPETSGAPDVEDETAKTEITASPEDTARETPQMEINSETGKDKYLTDPVPEGKPLPVEPENVNVGDGSFTVTLTIRCDTILDNMKLLHRDKHELVPEDGVIFPETNVTAYEGESVFNVLQREMRRNGIHMSSRFTPIYNSAYIEAINNLYEFDVGELSGWMYSVNGWYPNYGSSRYALNPGDAIELSYTCDLGRDLGQFWLTGRQQDE